MRRYKTYKDSGIAWIGDIPSHWNICRVKSLFFHISGNGFKIMYQGKQSGKYPFCKASDINGDQMFVSSAANYVDDEVAASEGYNIIPQNSILFSKIGEALKKNHRKINTIPCIVDNNCSALANHSNENIIYYYYVMKNIDMIWFDNAGVIPCVNIKKLMCCGLPLPPLAEQEAIVAFLDKKTSEIDDLVAQVEREIELLKEYKQAEIAKVVTKGLDPNVPMKPSGISWIGDIPAHWDVQKINQNFTERREKVSDKDFEPLSVTKEGVLPQLETAAKTNNGDNRKKVCKGDFVVNSRSDRKGSCGFSYYDGSVSLINTVLVPRSNIFGRYYHYVFRSNDFIEEFYRLGRGIVADLWTTRYTEQRNIMIPVPPLEEQQMMVDFIDHRTASIDRLMVELTYQVEYLKEYKQRLIADVVTGKINVQPN